MDDIIPIESNGDLKRLGYGARRAVRTRRKSLRSAVRIYGRRRTILKLNALRNLTKRKQPLLSVRYAQDLAFVQRL